MSSSSSNGNSSNSRRFDDARLIAHGPRRADELPASAEGSTWLTIGLDGPVISQGKPSVETGATHSWGWSEGRRFRARFDDQGDTVILAELTLSASSSNEETPDGDPVAAARDQVVLWDTDHTRLSENGQASMRTVNEAFPNGCESFTTLGLSPIVFVGPKAS